MNTIRCTAVVENTMDEAKCDEPIIASIADKIKEGIKLYDEKLEKNKTKKIIIEPLIKKKLKTYNCAKMMVGQIVYPKEKKFKGCKHVGKDIPKREILSREDHIKLLSQPRKVIIYICNE